MSFSDSGIGDFGSEGINAFITGHHCGDICKRLHLDQEIPLNLVDATGGGALENLSSGLRDTLDKTGGSDDDSEEDDHTQDID